METLGCRRGRRSLRIPMTPRAIDEPHRASTPLELLFDLTFVVAVSRIVAQLGHRVADGQTFGVLVLVAGVPSAFDAGDYRAVTVAYVVLGTAALVLAAPAAANDVGVGAVLVIVALVTSSAVVLRIVRGR